jgi:ABC-type glycerol-3-phosphate transport system substrate-binding protein
VLGKDEFASPEPWTTVNQRIEAGLANWGVRAVDDTGRVFQAATGQGKAFFQFWDKLLKEGLIIKPGTLPAAPRDVFNGGKLAVHDTFLSVWLQSKARVKDQFKIGCTHIPQGPPPGGKTSGIANTHQYAIHSDTKNLDLSWEYIKFFTGPELAQPLWDFPLPPARPALWQKNMSADPAIKLAADIMPSIRPNVRIWNGRTDEMWSGFQSDLDNIWLGKTDFETGFAAAIKGVNNVLAKPMA